MCLVSFNIFFEGICLMILLDCEFFIVIIEWFVFLLIVNVKFWFWILRNDLILVIVLFNCVLFFFIFLLLVCWLEVWVLFCLLIFVFENWVCLVWLVSWFCFLVCCLLWFVFSLEIEGVLFCIGVNGVVDVKFWLFWVFWIFI